MIEVQLSHGLGDLTVMLDVYQNM